MPNKKNNVKILNINEPETTFLQIKHYQFTNKCPELTITFQFNLTYPIRKIYFQTRISNINF